MFQPHGVIFRLIKYGIIQGTSVVTCYLLSVVHNTVVHNGMEKPSI